MCLTTSTNLLCAFCVQTLCFWEVLFPTSRAILSLSSLLFSFFPEHLLMKNFRVWIFVLLLLLVSVNHRVLVPLYASRGSDCCRQNKFVSSLQSENVLSFSRPKAHACWDYPLPNCILNVGLMGLINTDLSSISPLLLPDTAVSHTEMDIFSFLLLFLFIPFHFFFIVCSYFNMNVNIVFRFFCCFVCFFCSFLLSILSHHLPKFVLSSFFSILVSNLLPFFYYSIFPLTSINLPTRIQLPY